MQLSELLHKLDKLHEIHGDVIVLDQFECPITGVTFQASGEHQDAPYIELEVGEPE